MMSWPPLDPARLLFSGIYSGPSSLDAAFVGKAVPQTILSAKPKPAPPVPIAEQCTELLPLISTELSAKPLPNPPVVVASKPTSAPSGGLPNFNFNEIITHIFKKKLKPDPQYASVNWSEESDVLKYVDRLRFVGWVSDYLFEKSAPEENVLKSKLYTDLLAKISESIWKDIVVRTLCQMFRLQKLQ